MSLKIIKRKKVSRSKYGRIVFNSCNLEFHEKATAFCLASFGFDVETIIPSYIPKTKNPDLLMFGTTWEMKGPRTTNEETIRTKFRKAKRQSGGRAIFDLRNLGSNTNKIKKFIIRLFVETSGMHRIIIIEDDENLLDIFK